ncbi:MAG: hypothetical protein [Bacteriophage sp.]|nr:MAG: hypothetical protein [Bacteriophage sp.]
MKFIQWLKSLFTKKEREEMSDQSVVDAAAVAQPAVVQPVTAQPEQSADAGSVGSSTAEPVAAAAELSPLEQAKAKFDAFVEFVEHGLEVLGKDAEADLVALKDKFL